jgi:hypothetical protein
MPLKDDLRVLLRAADATPGQPKYHRLSKGLTVAIKANGDLIDLQLARNNVYPSAGEWKTVLNCWPEQASVEKEPKQIEKNGTFYLLGKLRRTPNLITA